MKQSGSVRILAVTAFVAVAIMAAKTLMPAIPLITTVMSAAMGLVLIFSLYRSDLRRFRSGVEADGSATEAEVSPLDSEAIRRRLEGRPVPQISPGPLTRAVAAHAEDARRARLLHAAPYDPPVLELVTEVEPVLELTEVIAAPGGVARRF